MWSFVPHLSVTQLSDKLLTSQGLAARLYCSHIRPQVYLSYLERLEGVITKPTSTRGPSDCACARWRGALLARSGVGPRRGLGCLPVWPPARASASRSARASTAGTARASSRAPRTRSHSGRALTALACADTYVPKPPYMYVRATHASLLRAVRARGSTVRTSYAYQPRAYRTYRVPWHHRRWHAARDEESHVVLLLCAWAWAAAGAHAALPRPRYERADATLRSRHAARMPLAAVVARVAPRQPAELLHWQQGTLRLTPSLSSTLSLTLSLSLSRCASGRPSSPNPNPNPNPN